MDGYLRWIRKMNHPHILHGLSYEIKKGGGGHFPEEAPRSLPRINVSEACASLAGASWLQGVFASPPIARDCCVIGATARRSVRRAARRSEGTQRLRGVRSEVAHTSICLDTTAWQLFLRGSSPAPPCRVQRVARETDYTKEPQVRMLTLLN